MRLHIRTINNYSYYSIIKDYTNINGKRSTKIFEKLGNQRQVEDRFGKNNTIEKIKEYINDLNSEDKNELVKLELNSSKRINKEKRNFNIGYLFLEKLYNDLKIKDICNKIQSNYKFEFDLNEVLSYLVFARIIYPSSKLETFKQCQNFIEQPTFKLHDEYRALSYIANNVDLIQESLFINSKNVIKRNSKVIYYDCTNYFFEIDEEDDLRRYGISKEHRPNPIVGMGLFMDGDGIPLSFNIYPGNQNEQKTLIPEESKIINDFKLDDTKVILCTDAGLASDEIKKYNIDDGRGFVITQSLKKIKEEYKEQIFDKKGWRLSGDLKKIYDLEEIEKNTDLKEKYYDSLFYKIVQTETKSVKQDTIVTFCFKYFDYNRNIRNNQIERAKKSISSNNVIRKGKNQNDPSRFIEEINATSNGEVASEKIYSINEDLIQEEDVVITLTNSGYIKRISADTYSAQRRGGRGIQAMTTKEDDFVENVLITSTHSDVLFFTNKGRVYKKRAYEIPDAGRTAKGTNIINLIPIEQDERIETVLTIADEIREGYLFMATKKGLVKKTHLSEFKNLRKNGLIAISLREGDELLKVKVTRGDADIVIVSEHGNAIKFNEQDVRAMGRTAAGVKSMNLREDDIAVCMDIAVDDEDLLVISENGFGKRTPLVEYKRQNRGGVGLITYKISEKTGKVVGATVCKAEDELMLINTSGVAIRINVSDVSVTSRATMGVRLMRTSDEERIAAIAKILASEMQEKDQQLSLTDNLENEHLELNEDTSLDRLIEEAESQIESEED